MRVDIGDELREALGCGPVRGARDFVAHIVHGPDPEEIRDHALEAERKHAQDGPVGQDSDVAILDTLDLSGFEPAIGPMHRPARQQQTAEEQDLESQPE